MRKLAIIAIITLVVAVSTHFGFQLERAGTVSFWVFAVAPTAVLAIVAGARAYTDGQLASWMRPVWGDFTRGLVGAALVFGAAYAFARFFQGTPRESWLARLYLQFGDPKLLREHATVFLPAIICAAVAEELVWRGLVTSLLAETIGSRWAWAWASAPYAIAHAPTLWALKDPEAGYNPVLPMAALGAGFVWGAMVRRFDGRLVPAMIAHAMFDWVVVFTFRLWGTSI